MDYATITIAGHPFQAPIKYAEGDTLEANEAGALNQTYHENLRNNFAKRVQEAKDAAGEGNPLSQDVIDKLYAEFAEYAAAYEFGVRGGGGGPRDPVQTEAMSLAREAIRAALKMKGKKLTGKNPDVTAEQITEAAKRLLAGEKGTKYLDLAKERVAQQRAAADETLDAVKDALV